MVDLRKAMEEEVSNEDYYGYLVNGRPPRVCPGGLCVSLRGPRGETGQFSTEKSATRL
jgi:hypothetical protein